VDENDDGVINLQTALIIGPWVLEYSSSSQLCIPRLTRLTTAFGKLDYKYEEYVAVTKEPIVIGPWNSLLYHYDTCNFETVEDLVDCLSQIVAEWNTRTRIISQSAIPAAGSTCHDFIEAVLSRLRQNKVFNLTEKQKKEMDQQQTKKKQAQIVTRESKSMLGM